MNQRRRALRPCQSTTSAQCGGKHRSFLTHERRLDRRNHCLKPFWKTCATTATASVSYSFRPGKLQVFMRYLPKSQSDREAMLGDIGVESIDDLFAAIPAEYRLTRDLNIPRSVCRERDRRVLPRARRRKRAGLRHLPRRGRLLALPPGGHRFAGLARRVLHRLHALPAGNRAGHAAGDLRIPDDDLRADRHGRGQRLHVRRLDRRRRRR